jgi:hypothetical protein
MSVSQMLIVWLTYHVVQTRTAIRPAHRAGQIAAAVAASGNPSGV